MLKILTKFDNLKSISFSSNVSLFVQTIWRRNILLNSKLSNGSVQRTETEVDHTCKLTTSHVENTYQIRQFVNVIHIVQTIYYMVLRSAWKILVSIYQTDGIANSCVDVKKNASVDWLRRILWRIG